MQVILGSFKWKILTRCFLRIWRVFSPFFWKICSFNIKKYLFGGRIKRKKFHLKLKKSKPKLNKLDFISFSFFEMSFEFFPTRFLIFILNMCKFFSLGSGIRFFKKQSRAIRRSFEKKIDSWNSKCVFERTKIFSDFVL